MLGHFFHKKNIIASDKSTSNIVNKLTAIRASGYNPEKINLISEQNLPQILILITDLGNKILRTRFVETTQLIEAQSEFSQIIQPLSNTQNLHSTVLYACHLLQYYTILCNTGLETNDTFENFSAFLDKNIKKFGDTSTNPFIVEHQLILIYNDLCTFTNSATGQLAAIKNLKEKNDQLLLKLTQFFPTITALTTHAPENAFYQYLKFVHSYASAKVTEFQFIIMKDTFNEEQALALDQMQKLFITACKTSIARIDALYQSANNILHPAAHENTFVSGAEFSFGANILVKLPVSSRDIISKHLNALG